MFAILHCLQHASWKVRRVYHCKIGEVIPPGILSQQVVLGEGTGQRVRLCGRVRVGQVGRLTYVSYGSWLRLDLHTTHRGGGRGFQAFYNTGNWLFLLSKVPMS